MALSKSLTTQTADYAPANLLAFCSWQSNRIKIMDLDKKVEYLRGTGAQLRNKDDNSWTHLREIPSTKLVVSLQHCWGKSAKLQILDFSRSDKLHIACSIDEVEGITGHGDIAYNSRRRLLGAIPVAGKVSYHLFDIMYNGKNYRDECKLIRKSKFHPRGKTTASWISGFDFDPMSLSVATIDINSTCLISDIGTGSYVFHLQMGDSPRDAGTDWHAKCRWSIESGEPILWTKYNMIKLNLLDVEKQTRVWEASKTIVSEPSARIYWIDLCPSDANLIAACGTERAIKIYDRRGPKKGIRSIKTGHTADATCVRWNAKGDALATSSEDETVRLIDFKAEKPIYSEKTSDGAPAMSVCFI